MKKIIAFMLCTAVVFTFAACGKPENRADVSLKEGETKITGTVERVSGNILTISDGEGGRYSFCYSDEVTAVEDGWYVTDYAADSFRGKRVTIICSELIMETYPAQLREERMIIIE